MSCTDCFVLEDSSANNSLFKVLQNTSDECSKIPSMTTALTKWLRTEQFSLCYVIDVLMTLTLTIITLDALKMHKKGLNIHLFFM